MTVILLGIVTAALIAAVVVSRVLPRGSSQARSAKVVVSQPPPGSPYIAPVGRSPIPQPGEQLKRPFAYQPAAPPAVRYTQQPPTNQIVDWQQAGRYVGQVITVRGRIVDTHNTGEVCFLNFSKHWQGQFYLIVFADQFDHWPTPPQNYFLDRTVLVTGKVQQHRGRPQIRITSPEQVTVQSND